MDYWLKGNSLKWRKKRFNSLIAKIGSKPYKNDTKEIPIKPIHDTRRYKRLVASSLLLLPRLEIHWNENSIIIPYTKNTLSVFFIA